MQEHGRRGKGGHMTQQLSTCFNVFAPTGGEFIRGGRSTGRVSIRTLMRTLSRTWIVNQCHPTGKA